MRSFCATVCKYEQIVVKFMFDFFGCDYCVLRTVNMLGHVEVMFIQLLNLLERYINVNRHSSLVPKFNNWINITST